MAGIQLKAQRIRFAVDASRPFGTAQDVITNQTLTLPSGSALQLELLFFFGNLLDAALLDLSVFSQINIQLQDNADPHSGTVFYAGAIAAANFQTPTVAAWNAGATTPSLAAQQITLNITSAQNVVPPAATTYWICIYGIVAATGDSVLLAANSITGKDSGVPITGAALSQNLKLGGKLPFICSPANGGDGLTRDLLLAPGPLAGQWITYVNQAGYAGPGQVAYSMLCDPANGGDGLFRDLTLQGQPGAGGIVYTLAINQNGHS